ncbi:MAG: BMC domain-containing protein [Armatimonadota bacterium]|nr:BMC domain-containing protein [Armatimonadota bacterium]
MEVVTLTAVIRAADAALKAADVQLEGFRVTGGRGWVCVRLTGEVAAVKTAVDAACEWAARVNQVVATHVIARPGPDVARLAAGGAGLAPPRQAVAERERRRDGSAGHD